MKYRLVSNNCRRNFCKYYRQWSPPPLNLLDFYSQQCSKRKGGFPWSIFVESLTASLLYPFPKQLSYASSSVKSTHGPRFAIIMCTTTIPPLFLWIYIFVSLFYWSTGAAGVRPRGIRKASCLQTPLNRFLSHNLSQFRRAHTKKWDGRTFYQFVSVFAFTGWPVGLGETGERLCL